MAGMTGSYHYPASTALARILPNVRKLATQPLSQITVSTNEDGSIIYSASPIGSTNSFDITWATTIVIVNNSNNAIYLEANVSNYNLSDTPFNLGGTVSGNMDNSMSLMVGTYTLNGQNTSVAFAATANTSGNQVSELNPVILLQPNELLFLWVGPTGNYIDFGNAVDFRELYTSKLSLSVNELSQYSPRVNGKAIIGLVFILAIATFLILKYRKSSFTNRVDYQLTL